jgi:hypothetical protein
LKGQIKRSQKGWNYTRRGNPNIKTQFSNRFGFCLQKNVGVADTKTLRTLRTLRKYVLRRKKSKAVVSTVN